MRFKTAKLSEEQFGVEDATRKVDASNLKGSCSVPSPATGIRACSTCSVLS